MLIEAWLYNYKSCIMTAWHYPNEDSIISFSRWANLWNSSCIFMDFLSFFLPNCNIKLMTCRDNSLTADYQWISWSKNPWELCQNHMIFPPFVTWPKHIVLFWLSSRIILWHGGRGIAFILSGFKNVSLTIHWWPKSRKKMQLYLCIYKAKRLNF